MTTIVANLEGFLGGEGQVWGFLTRDRQSDMAFQLQHQGQPLTLDRLKTQEPQTVLLATPASGSLTNNTVGGVGGKNTVLVFGLPTLDIQINDKFMWEGVRYTVRFVDKSVPNKVTATCEASQ